MNIVGFGDSFILGLSLDKEVVNSQHRWPYLYQNKAWNASYQGMLGNHYKCIPEFRGVPGTGPWNMFFDFLNYRNKENIDVVIIAWSEIARLYHRTFQPVNTHIINDQEKFKNSSQYEKDVIIAANHYYKSLFDDEKKNYELKALMHLFDYMTIEYKHIKFIHLSCFTWLDQGEWWGRDFKKKKPHELKYFYDFKHGMEIRPALMYMSMMDEWPEDLSNDRRECHMTPRVNRMLADKIIDCIENYQPGKLLDMDVSLIK